MMLHVGTSGYGYKEWKGVFYPDRIPGRDMLRFYAGRLNTVEINYTFYHMPTEKVLLAWAEQVPDNFSFALKAPQIITHRKRLRDVDGESDYFFRTIAILGRKMGPVLFQFPRSFRVDRPALEDFLDLLPVDIPCAFEFRNRSWLEPGVLQLLQDRNCCLCVADSDEQPAGEILSTASWGYLRLRRSDYSEADLKQWKKLILARKWQRAFVFFKHEEQGRGPALAMRFQELAGSGRRDVRAAGAHDPAERRVMKPAGPPGDR
ncbi:MAG TPA: DUF72 domain-containing protein [Desulfobacteraceae bacterium]|nr:DUF72 domain-containing protein [Desulfobacteraceae bacterium]